MFWLRRYAHPTLVGLLLAACVWALVVSWDDVADALPRVGFSQFALATLAAVGAGLTVAVGWRLLLHDLSNRPVGIGESVAVFSAGQLGRYIPGSVWAPLAQLSLGRNRGISRRAIGAAFVAHVLALLVTGLVVAAATLPWVDAEQLKARWWLLILVPAMGALLVPAVQRRVFAVAGRIVGREFAMAMPRVAAVGTASVACVITFVLFGLHLALLGWPLMQEPGVDFLVQSVGAFALAWVVGFLVVFAPAGLGVRELVLTLTLSSFLTRDDSTAVAVMSRFSIVLADLLLGVFGLVYLRLGRAPGISVPDNDAQTSDDPGTS